jgi:hypothetical protein
MIDNFMGKYVNLEMHGDILIGTYKKGLKITLPIAKEIVSVRLVFTNNTDLPALILNQGVVSMDKDARDFLSSKEGVKGLKAGAIVLDSPFSSFLGNFFIRISKPKIPAKIFTNKEDALIWLEQFLS